MAEFKKVHLNVNTKLHALISKYADDMGVSLTAWCIFALTNRAANWTELSADGKSFRARKGERKGKSSEIEADTVSSEPVSFHDDKAAENWFCHQNFSSMEEHIYDDKLTHFMQEHGYWLS